VNADDKAIVRPYCDDVIREAIVTITALSAGDPSLV
jgi:hypothetical protein